LLKFGLFITNDVFGTGLNDCLLSAAAFCSFDEIGLFFLDEREKIGLICSIGMASVAGLVYFLD